LSRDGITPSLFFCCYSSAGADFKIFLCNPEKINFFVEEIEDQSLFIA
jgi:hypothetical protein